MVMRAGGMPDPSSISTTATSAANAATAAMIYHINCFQCSTCRRVLHAGERYVLHGQDLFCRSQCFDLALSRLSQVGTAYNPLSHGLNGNPTGGGGGWMNTGTGPAGFLPPSAPFAPKPNLVVHAPGVHPMLPSLGSGGGGVYPPEGQGGGEQSQLQLIGQPPEHELPSQPANATQLHRSSTTLSSSTADSPTSYSNPDSIPPSTASTTNSSSAAAGGIVGGSGRAGLGRSSSGTVGGVRGSKKRDKPTQRIRTVLNESQLKILKQMYHSNQRPDTVTKDHLVEMTGLSSRVIRVWFQNKRCKVSIALMGLVTGVAGG